MTQEKLDKQRDVVRNERRQSIENQPYGKAELKITEIMFPGDHPYHNEVIGTHEDLEAAQLIDVTDFFAAFYVPNNASLVVAGDFDSAQVKPLVASLFGTLPRGADPMHKTAAPVTLGRVVRAVTLDQVQQPKVAMCYHSPPAYATGDAECDLLAAVLTDGKSSRLYKRLVEQERLASDVSAFQSSAMLQSVFRIDTIVMPGADLGRVEAVIDEEIARMLESGPTSEELEQRKATIELSKVAQLQSVLAKADKLNEYEFHFGTPDGFRRDLDRYRAATPQAVHAWARRVLTQDSRLVLRVLPTEPEREASPRDQRPPDLAVGDFDPPAPETFTLPNGVPVMLWTKPELPIVSMRVLFTPGGPLDTPATAGLSNLAAQMLDEGAGDYSAEQFADAVQALGATFSASAGGESASAGLTVVRRNFEPAARLAALAIRSPAMRQADWERVQRLHLEDLKQQDAQPTIVAARVGQRVLFGDESPYAWPESGTASTVASFTLDQVKARGQALFAPACATILIAGDLSRTDAEKALSQLFADWKGGSPRRPAPVAGTTPGTSLRVVVVDRPNAVQTVVRYLAPGFPADDPRRVPCSLLNTILGGSFTSRLNQNLREDHGYTYGARSRFVSLPSAGYFMASASVRADATGESLVEFTRELARLRGGDATDAEVAKARETVRTNTVEAFQGVGGVVGTASWLVESKLPFATIAADLAAARRITAADLNRAARAAIPLEAGVLVLMGDKKTISEDVAALSSAPDLSEADKDLVKEVQALLARAVEYTINGDPRR
jgi:zinc protease